MPPHPGRSQSRGCKHPATFGVASLTTVASTVKSTVTIIVLIVLIATPAVITALLGQDALTGFSVNACLAGVVAGTMTPWRHAAVMAVVFGLGGALAVPGSQSPVLGVLLMLMCAAGLGVAARAGASSYVTMAPITLSFVVSEPLGVTSLAAGLTLSASAAFGAVLGAGIRRKIPNTPLTPLSVQRSAAYAGMLAVLSGVGVWFVVSRNIGHTGAWFLMTLFLVIQPYLQDAWQKSRQRALGTVLGFGVALVIGLVLHVQWALFTLGMLSMMIAIWVMIKHIPYWKYTIFITVGVVLTQGAGTSVIRLGELRVLATVLGVVVSLAAVALLQPIYRRLAESAGLERY